MAPMGGNGSGEFDGWRTLKNTEICCAERYLEILAVCEMGAFKVVCFRVISSEMVRWRGGGGAGVTSHVQQGCAGW